MTNVYLIKPLEKKSICWHIEMYRENADGSTSWFTVNDHYRWGQGFIEEENSCELPYENDEQVCTQTGIGFGAELDDRHACFFDFSDDVTDSDREIIKSLYREGGSGWLFDGDHDWREENDYLIIDAPYQVSLCNEDGTVIEEHVTLKARE